MGKYIGKAKRKLMQILPKDIKFKLIRHLVKAPTEIPRDYTFKIADTKEEFEQAYKIIHDSYVNCGFIKPSPSAMRVLKHFLLPTTQTVIVKYKSKLIGTMSVIRRTKIGLPLEDSFSIQDYIVDGEPSAEVSSLTIDKEHSGAKGLLFLPFCKFTIEFISQYMGINKIIITVNPSMDTLQDDELKYISQMYPAETESDYMFKIYNDTNLKKLISVKNRKNRAITSNKCNILSLTKKRNSSAYLLDVSDGVLKIGIKEGMFKMTFGEPVEISFFILKIQEVKVHENVRWINPNEYTFGIEITHVLNNNWFQYIRYLNSEKTDKRTSSKVTSTQIKLQKNDKAG